MRLEQTQRQALVDDGYLLVPGLVPRARIDAALKAINHSLGKEGIAKDQLPKLSAQSFCEELMTAPEILDLYRATPLGALAEAAIGAGRVVAPKNAQIALRFPHNAEPKLPRPHIDGVPSALNGVEAGTLHHFTALAAVFLSDLTGPFQGNFTVWPGSHRALEAHFRAHGTTEILRKFSAVEMATPRQLEARAGDGLLAHYQLAHSAALNVGPHVRYAVFFRLARRGRDDTSTATLTDLWREWDGVRRPPAA